MSFSQFGLCAQILRAVGDQGYTEPTPIQAQSIPLVLEGRDLMAGAQTGTGKTAAFTLPMLERLGSIPAETAPRGRRPIRALILAPTRELAAQVQDNVRTYAKYLPIRSTAVYGGVAFVPQVQAIKNGVDILVATPGRLLDHVQQRTIDLSRVQFLVLDEADRMLDMGFIHDIKKIMAHLSADRQSLLFSATFSDEIKSLADSLLRSPALIEVARRNTAAETVTQVVHPVEQDRKRELLAHLVKTQDMQRVLVFARTKHGAERLSEQLRRDGIHSDAIHGDRSQSQRLRSLAAFKNGKTKVLVATDVAARGLDIDLLPHVVNFDLPQVAEDYVHRIGRTGRAGNSGDAISLVSADEVGLLHGIERVLKNSIPRQVIPGFEHVLPTTAGRGTKAGSRSRTGGFGNRQPGQWAGRRDGKDSRGGEKRYSFSGRSSSSGSASTNTQQDRTARRPASADRVRAYDWNN